jgi:imidazolonepropionase
LRAARTLDGRHGVQVVTTLLAAHALPPEYRGRGGAYVAEVAIPALRAAHVEGLVDAVDAFCEGIAFSAAEIAPLFAEARALGLPVKLHAEQLGHSGGVALAAAHGALSADHLEHATAGDAALMAAAGTVAVLLPGAYYVLRETARPPVDAFRAHGVPMAVATDMNPGTSPLLSLRIALHMACTLFGLTVEEAMLGATVHAARALGLADRGRIAPGLRADLTVWDTDSLAGVIGTIAGPPPYLRITNGDIRHA